MKLFVIALLVLNAIYFFLPTAETDSESEVVRGDSRVALLVRLGEEDSELGVTDAVNRQYSPAETVAAAPVAKPALVEAAVEKVSRPSESAAEPQVEESPRQEKQKSEPVPVCYTVGPFHRESKAELLTADLQKAEFKVDWRASKERRTRGYSVFLPSYASYEAAEAVVKNLSEQGVTDYYILTDANRRNAISLGFFTLKSGSEKRVNRLKSMGYSPQVEVRFDEVPVFWLDFEARTEQAFSTFWEQNPPADNLELLTRDCK